jgi:hypothetical protein
VPSVLTAHAWSSSTLTDVNEPEGGVVWPPQLLLQQAMVPSVFTPHANCIPALTDVNVPAGGIPAPWPQHAAVPSGFTPQAKPLPTLMEANVPVGDVARSLYGLQQTTVPSLLRPQAVA